MWKPASDYPFQARIYIHVFEKSQQNGEDVNAILIHLLQQIKDELPTVETAYIRSDNGPHYHQSALMASVHHISEQSGIFIKRWSFSEAQAGKGPCDRTAAIVKNQLYRYIDSNDRIRRACAPPSGMDPNDVPQGARMLPSSTDLNGIPQGVCAPITISVTPWKSTKTG